MTMIVQNLDGYGICIQLL